MDSQLSHSLAPFTQHNLNGIWPQFKSNSWLWHHRSQPDCDLGVQTTFEIFGESCLLQQSLIVFGCARRIFGLCKQNEVCFGNLQASSVVLRRFLDHINKTKKMLSNHLCRLVVWANQQLQMQVRHSYHSRITFESLVRMKLLRDVVANAMFVKLAMYPLSINI